MPPTQAARKLLGAWYTPPELVDIVVDNVLRGFRPAPRTRTVRVLDPACGDGRFLFAVRTTARRSPVSPPSSPDVTSTGTALRRDRPDRCARSTTTPSPTTGATRRSTSSIGNPPFLSQMAAATTRGGASRHGGGPYADAAVEFLALAVRLARPDGGRVGLVLPQSIVGARDAGPVRAEVERMADLTWSWWAPRQRHFDAAVNVCALGFRAAGDAATMSTSRGPGRHRPARHPRDRLERLGVDGTLGERAEHQRQLPRRVLRPRARRERRWRRAATGDERTDRPRCVPVGTSGR